MILALGACGVAAAVVSVQAIRRSPDRSEATRIPAHGSVLVPAPSTHEQQSSAGEALTEVPLDARRMDVTDELDGPLVVDNGARAVAQPTALDHVPLRLVREGAEVANAAASTSCVAFSVDPTAILDDDVELVHGSGGELWLARRTLEALVAEAEPGRPLHLALLDRGRSRARVGFLGGPFDAAQSELVLDEVGTAHVQLRAKERVLSRFTLSIHAQLVDASTLDPRLRQITADLGLGFHWESLAFEPGVNVASVQSGLLPGRWTFSFFLPSAPLMQIEPVVVELVQGPQEIIVEVPELFEVTVHAPALEKGVRLRLSPQKASTPLSPGRAERDHASLDGAHRAVFSGLPAGHYVLTHGASHEAQTIVVPCGEVLYEPRRSDAFEVRLAPLDSGGQGALALAGFQTGDVLLEFNGRGLREHDDLDALVQVIAENEATVRVRRGAHTLELRLGPMPDPGDPWATFDADFVPAWR